MCADIFTKGFTEADKWNLVCKLICIIDPAELRGLVKETGEIEADPGGASAAGAKSKGKSGAGDASVASNRAAAGGSSVAAPSVYGGTGPGAGTGRPGDTTTGGASAAGTVSPGPGGSNPTPPHQSGGTGNRSRVCAQQKGIQLKIESMSSTGCG